MLRLIDRLQVGWCEHCRTTLPFAILLPGKGGYGGGVHVQGGSEGHPRQAGRGPCGFDSRQAPGAPNRRPAGAGQGETSLHIHTR